MTDLLFEKTCIIGLGLIGSSLALAMRDNNLCPDIVGADLSQSVCDEAIALGVVGAAAPKIPQAVKGCDLIILAVPVGTIGSVLIDLNKYADPGTIIMDVEHHDVALAVTSHLPHLIAFTLVSAADDIESVSKREVVKYSAGGFRDFTRIAASDPVMWRDVFLTNRDAVLDVLGRFSEELAVMQRAIRWGDGEALEKAFSRAKDIRQAIIEAGQETDEANFGRDEKK